MNQTDKVLSELLKTFIGLDINNIPRNNFPKYEVIKDNQNNQYMLRLLLAGYRKEDLNVYVENNKLYIESEKTESEYNDEKYTYSTERVIARRAFKISFSLEGQLEVSNELSKFENGILEIVLKNKEVQERKSISIN